MKIKIINIDKSEEILEGISGWTLMEILRDAKKVPAICGGNAQCSTCHVRVKEPYLSSLEEISYEEDGVKHILTPGTYVSMNFWGFPPSVLPLFEEKFVDFVAENNEDPKSECFIPVEVDNLMAEGKASVKVVPTSASWLGVTYKEDKPFVVQGIKQMIADGKYPEEVK